MKPVNETDISKLWMVKADDPAQDETDPSPLEDIRPEDAFITAHMVGRFYLSPPGKSPLVSCGDPVAKGQKICIVESLKIPNEIISEVDGQIEEILCEDGQAVEYGQSLFRVRLN